MISIVKKLALDSFRKCSRYCQTFSFLTIHSFKRNVWIALFSSFILSHLPVSPDAGIIINKIIVSPERLHEVWISLQPSPPLSRFYCLCESHCSPSKDNHGVIIASPNVCKRISKTKKKNSKLGRCSKRSAMHNAPQLVPCLRCFHKTTYMFRVLESTSFKACRHFFFFLRFFFP